MKSHNKNKLYVDIIPQHSEVSGSCNYCTVNFPDGRKTSFLVDCGLFQEEKYKERNYSFSFDVKNVYFALVTHNHIDHIGRIPKLYKDGFDGMTYATSITSQLMPTALNNTAEILLSENKRVLKKIKKASADPESSIPNNLSIQKDILYSKNDVETALNNTLGIEYDTRINVAQDIYVTFIKNNHILGSTSILVEVSCKNEDSIYILFSGDYSKENVALRKISLPKYVKNLPITIIQESTYGNSSKELIVPCFKNNVVNSIKENETLIIPVFALGRSQEILLTLSQMQKDKLLSEKIPIYFDGALAKIYTNFYSNNKNYLNNKMKDFIPKNLISVEQEMRIDLISNRNTKIIVTTSGMGNYGPAQIYIPAYISDSKCTIHFTGYTPEGTLGHSLKTTPSGELCKIAGKEFKRKAHILYTNEFSGHAKQEDLLDFLDQFNNIKSVLINHGNHDAKKIYAEKVRETINTKDVEIMDVESCIRINAFGFVKSFPNQNTASA